MQSSEYAFTMPSSTCMSEDLLFFDTFSHPNSDKENFDLVQFPSPVVIDLIKVVPLGQPIEAKIPGNVRLGATNPSKCELEFFINDLTKQDAHTMTDLGKFYCTEKDTDFSPPLQIQTDGLLLRGSYRTLTLAIFGQIAIYEEKHDDEQAILSAASPPAQTPASPVASERDIPYIVRSVDHQELLRRARDEEESLEMFTLKSSEHIKEDIDSPLQNIDISEDAIMDLVEVNGPTTVKREIANIETLSNNDGDLPTKFEFHDKRSEENEYPNSGSEIDNLSKRSHREDENERMLPESINFMGLGLDSERRPSDDHALDHDAREWHFDVDLYNPKPLIYFPDPSSTLQERTLHALKSKSAQRNYKETADKEIEKVREMFEVLGCPNDAKTEEWVVLVEDLTNDITNMSLSQTVINADMLRFLVHQVSLGLDVSLAIRQKQTGFKVRHLKAGIKLATTLLHCGKLAVSELLENNILEKVLQLYNKEQMSLPLHLLIFRCLNAACDTVEGVEHVINHKYAWQDSNLSFNSIKQSLYKKDILKIETEEQEAETNTSELHTCYQYMIMILLSQPTTRVTIAVGNLIKKIRLYQNLMQLSALGSLRDDEDISEDSVFEVDHDGTQSQIDRMAKGIDIIHDSVNLMKDGCFNIAQPMRFLPAKTQFHIKPSMNDNYLAIYRWLKHFHIIESIDTMLMSIEPYRNSDKLQFSCREFIKQIIESPRGTQLLLSSDYIESTSSLIRTLARRPEMHKSSSIQSTDGLQHRNNWTAANACRDLSLELCYNFKVFSCIDKLFDFHRKVINKRSEATLSSDPEKILHQLYIMADHPFGLSAIMKHFSSFGNLECILRFLDVTNGQKHLEFVKETIIDYVIELVGTFFRLNDKVLEVSEEYLETLIEMYKIKDSRLSSRIKLLLPWLTPFDVDRPLPLITYSEETFRQLVRVIRKSIPDCSIPFARGLNFELPPQMITAVRILRQLCIPPQVESYLESNLNAYPALMLDTAATTKQAVSEKSTASEQQSRENQSSDSVLQPAQAVLTAESIVPHPDHTISLQLQQINRLMKLYQPYDETVCGDLKYHYGVMQVFEHEGLKRLLNTLRELTGNYSRPVYQSAALGGCRGRIVISYIHGVIVMLHSITCHLIDARGKEFKDISIVPVILETYSLLCFVPKPDEDKIKAINLKNDLSSLQKSITIASDNYRLAQQTKTIILSILMSYTQMCLSVSESEENVISKSMWTKMLSETIDFTLSTPVFFHHGLDILTRIIPAPLPNSFKGSESGSDQEQMTKCANYRKLWSAHLHPLHQKLEQMISSLSVCYQRNIRFLLCYLCNQLSDLSSTAACMVVKIITGTLIAFASKLSLDSNGEIVAVENSNQGNTTHPSRSSEDRLGSFAAVVGTKESKYAVNMILDMMSNLISNHAFETALTNHLQVVMKKDEKLIANLQAIIRIHHEDLKPFENNEGLNLSTSVTSFVESIKLLAESRDATKEDFSPSASVLDTNPPDELTKINLIALARTTSDRFILESSIAKTYRLKVLLDLNKRAHKSGETSSSKKFERSTPYNYQELMMPTNHKAYAVPPTRGRGRQSSRPDSFRSRTQNTSRPPSIHVDDFNDLHGDSSGQSNSRARYSGGNGKLPAEYRSSNSSRSYVDVGHSNDSNHRHSFFNPPQPPIGPGQGPSALQGPPPYGGGGRHSKAKYVKMK